MTRARKVYVDRASPIKLRLSVSEAFHLFADKVVYHGGESLFGCNVRDWPRDQPVWYDLTKAFGYEVVPLYARAAGSSNSWSKVDGSYFENNLRLNREADGEFSIWPRGMIGMVPTDFSVLRKDIMRLIRHPDRVIESWMLPKW